MRVPLRTVIIIVRSNGDARLRYPQATWVSRSKKTLKTRPGQALQKRGVDSIRFFPNFFMLGMYDEYRQWRCRYCKGSGKAPGNGRTQCGFCQNGFSRE